MPNFSVSGVGIRNLGPLVNAAMRYAQNLYQPPKQSIRGISPDGWYSPLQPVAPFAPAGTEPKGFQFFAGQNLNWTPRFDAEYTAYQLKYLATYPLARICIENVKDILCKAKWTVDPKPEPGESRKQAAARGKGDKKIIELTKRLERPDREHSWDAWLRPLCEDMLVIDAASILIRKRFNGEVAELVVLRGESIARYIDDNGLTPMAPDPGYAQIWWGMPIVNLSTDQLLYKPRNIAPRNSISSQLYGMSPTEQLAPELEIGWDELRFAKAYYTEGSIPGMLQVVPKGVSAETIQEALLATNTDLAGNYAKRHQLRLIPGFADGSKGEKDQVILTKENLLQDPYSEQRIRKVAFGYGVSPQRLMKQMNRASSEQADEATQEENTDAYFQWLKFSVVDRIIADVFQEPGYEWIPDPYREPSFEKMAAAINDIMNKPVYTPNEIREKMGEEPRPEPEANQLGYVSPSLGWQAIGVSHAIQGADVDEKGNVTVRPDENIPKGKSNEPKPAAGGGKNPEDTADGGEKPAGGKPNGKIAAIGRTGKNGSGEGHQPHNRAANFGFGSAVDESQVVLGKYSEEEERDEHGRWSGGGGATEYTKPEIKEGPTAWLIKNQVEELPQHHLDGLKSIDFQEHQYLQIASAAHGGKVVEAYGVYSPNDRTITLSSNKDNIGVIGGGTVIHEVGHNVQLAKLTDAGAEEWAKISDNGQHALISAYARTNQGEHFAEAYRAYEKGGNDRARLRNLEPAAYKYMRSIHSESSDKILPPGKFADSTGWMKRYDPKQVH